MAEKQIRDTELSETGTSEKTEQTCCRIASLEAELKGMQQVTKMAALETELKDMRERYLHMSLQYAEVEAQREELVLKLKTTAKGGKGWFSWDQEATEKEQVMTLTVPKCSSNSFICYCWYIN